MPNDFEPLVADIKKSIYRAVANGLRIVNYLKFDHHLKNINYFKLLYMILS